MADAATESQALAKTQIGEHSDDEMIAGYISLWAEKHAVLRQNVDTLVETLVVAAATTPGGPAEQLAGKALGGIGAALGEGVVLSSRAKIVVTGRGLAHAMERHILGGAKTAGKSVFNAGESIPALAKAAESTAPVLQQGSKNFERVVDAGRAIGVDRVTGQATSTYTVITNAAGELVTTFPGKP